MNQRKIYFRADGSFLMGLGHVFRSLAVVQMVKEHYECHFIIHDPLEVLKQNINSVCASMTVIQKFETMEAEAHYLTKMILSPEDIVVTDGYHFRTAYQEILREFGCKLVCLDDIHAFKFFADAVVNHAPGMKPEVYEVAQHTKLCLGLDYALLRPPFLKAAQRPRKIEKVSSLFICFGGSDYNNIALRILDALKGDPPLLEKIHIVLGGAYKFYEEMVAFQAENPEMNIKLHRNLSAAEMVTVMQDSQLAIAPASSILYEILSVKMPAISGFYVDNQINIYEGFKALDLVYGIGEFEKFHDYRGLIEKIIQTDPKPMMEKQQSLLKGKSKENFLSIFDDL